MSFIINGEEKMKNGDVYWFNPKHRDSDYLQASIWKVNMKIEFCLCEEAIDKEYCVVKSDVKKFAFNLNKSNNKIDSIGIGNQNEKLQLAKFNNSTAESKWHGYPANHLAKNNDIPPQEVLTKMFNNKLISKSEMRKIKKGQKL